jgi:hypothetical protein
MAGVARPVAGVGYWMRPKQLQSVSPAAHGAPVGPAQLLPAQHGCVSEHDWPTYEHVDMPMSPDGGGAAPQVPTVWPGGTVQSRPAQQSAFDVHWPVVFEHCEPQRSTPLESGTHGAPLQHSAEKVHCCPGSMQHGGWPL